MGQWILLGPFLSPKAGALYCLKQLILSNDISNACSEWLHSDWCRAVKDTNEHHGGNVLVGEGHNCSISTYSKMRYYSRDLLCPSSFLRKEGQKQITHVAQAVTLIISSYTEMAFGTFTSTPNLGSTNVGDRGEMLREEMWNVLSCCLNDHSLSRNGDFTLLRQCPLHQ